MEKNIFRLLCCFLFFVSFCFSQSELLDRKYYNYYDSIVQYENIGVFNGLEYIDRLISLDPKDHKFYGSSNFSNGFVVYDGQPYHDLGMKYDVLNDLLVIQYINIKINNLALNPSLVTEFKLINERFVRLPKSRDIESFYGNGFFKLAFKGDRYSVLVKYLKGKVEKIKYDKIYYRFTDNEIYLVNYEDRFYRVKSVKDVVTTFPSKKKQIQSFFNENRRLYKKNRCQFIEKLFRSFDTQERSI